MESREICLGPPGTPASSRKALLSSTCPRQRRGDVAQLGERLVCNQEVGGSSPLISTSFPDEFKRETAKRLAPDAGRFLRL